MWFRAVPYYREWYSDNTQVSSSGVSEKVTDIINELTAYVKNGEWKAAVRRKLTDVPVEYLWKWLAAIQPEIFLL